MVHTSTGIAEQAQQLELQKNELKLYCDQLEEFVIHRTVELEMVHSLAEEARIQAESANQTKCVFLANMSHKLRTPLNAIINYGHMLSDYVAHDDFAQSELLEDLERVTHSGITFTVRLPQNHRSYSTKPLTSAII